ncbi:MAG: hypothetical protein ABFD96_23895 [Armatimonadia bacterium]
MAVTAIGATYHKFIGLSSDTKPTDVAAGATFQELNTGLCWIFDGSDWVEDLSMIYAVNQGMKG